MHSLNPKQKIALIFGGVSTEHDVSVVSARSVAEYLDTERFEPLYVGIDKQGRWFAGPGAFDLLKTGKEHDVQRVIFSTDPEKRGFLAIDNTEIFEVDVAFPVLHGPRGEDGTMQGLLDLSGIPYVGCDTMSSAIAMDKDMTKRVLAQRGIPVVKGTCITRWMWQTDRDEVLGEIADTLSPPLFIKPATMGSSIGITKASGVDEIVRGIDKALCFSPKVVIENAVVNALEIEVAVLGNNEPVASIPGQIIPSNDFYDFDAKYVDGKTELIIPAKIGKALMDDIQFAAVDAFVAIGGTGMARIDFLISQDAFYVNEINTIPGFTSISMYPKLWEATGIPYPQLITALIDLAFKRHEECQSMTKVILLEKDLGV
ncbi:MAG: D-alanine--D-alanine ligase [Deltaproteobacteria bacterium]|nr:D-alanine--D-alanine ligase [Deltaproteobacteria bacterium]